jgi:hypothetical protein
METALNIAWIAMVSVFCILGLFGTIRQIKKSEENSEEFKHAAEEGFVDSDEFPRED